MAWWNPATGKPVTWTTADCCDHEFVELNGCCERCGQKVVESAHELMAAEALALAQLEAEQAALAQHNLHVHVQTTKLYHSSDWSFTASHVVNTAGPLVDNVAMEPGGIIKYTVHPVRCAHEEWETDRQACKSCGMTLQEIEQGYQRVLAKAKQAEPVVEDGKTRRIWVEK
jgi:ribosomal protein L37E